MGEIAPYRVSDCHRKTGKPTPTEKVEWRREKNFQQRKQGTLGQEVCKGKYNYDSEVASPASNLVSYKPSAKVKAPGFVNAAGHLRQKR